ncbi:MAG: nucleotide exchange factor GrpE [Candidatus Nomurabacteria bacterium]|nr:nucleotide exchange factor GrpE [Candidatus Nomurabacteria bacterium]
MNDEEIINKTTEESIESDISYVDSNEDGEALPTKDVVKKLREDLKQVRSDKEEYLTGWQRAKADYVNLQKEMDQVRANTSLLTKEKIVENLLPALDSFDMAFANKDAWEKVDQNWRVGVEYIYQQFINSLSDSGVEKIDKSNISFDPNIHQSMESVATDDESKDHTIEKIIQAGYKIGDRVIRPARVNIYEYKK